jgi:hypothetical protein
MKRVVSQEEIKISISTSKDELTLSVLIFRENSQHEPWF